MKIYLDTNILKASIDSVIRMFPRKRTLHLANGNTIALVGLSGGVKGEFRVI